MFVSTEENVGPEHATNASKDHEDINHSPLQTPAPILPLTFDLLAKLYAAAVTYDLTNLSEDLAITGQKMVKGSDQSFE